MPPKLQDNHPIQLKNLMVHPRKKSIKKLWLNITSIIKISEDFNPELILAWNHKKEKEKKQLLFSIFPAIKIKENSSVQDMIVSHTRKSASRKLTKGTTPEKE